MQYRQYYSRYPQAGFGTLFAQWAKDPELRINRSYANGAVMRAVPIGYAYGSIRQIRLEAKAMAYYTHHHPAAIKAAEAVACAVFLANKGASKLEIRSFLEQKFGYRFSQTIDALRRQHIFNSCASYSVPAALLAFFESTDYESAIRNAVSLGGDADTEACIAGGIAEAYYKSIPKHISDFCDRKIELHFKQVLYTFRERFCGE